MTEALTRCQDPCLIQGSLLHSADGMAVQNAIVSCCSCAGTSVQNMVHWAQGVRRKVEDHPRFAKYDWGEAACVLATQSCACWMKGVEPGHTVRLLLHDCSSSWLLAP